MLVVIFTDRNVKDDMSFNTVSHQIAVPATGPRQAHQKAILTVAKLSGTIG